MNSHKVKIDLERKLSGEKFRLETHKKCLIYNSLLLHNLSLNLSNQKKTDTEGGCDTANRYL